jgi:hypothetical protein
VAEVEPGLAESVVVLADTAAAVEWLGEMAAGLAALVAATMDRLPAMVSRCRALLRWVALVRLLRRSLVHRPAVLAEIPVPENMAERPRG